MNEVDCSMFTTHNLILSNHTIRYARQIHLAAIKDHASTDDQRMRRPCEGAGPRWLPNCANVDPQVGAGTLDQPLMPWVFETTTDIYPAILWTTLL